MGEYFRKMKESKEPGNFPQDLGHSLGDRLGERIYQSLETKCIKKEELKEIFFRKKHIDRKLS